MSRNIGRVVLSWLIAIAAQGCHSLPTDSAPQSAAPSARKNFGVPSTPARLSNATNATNAAAASDSGAKQNPMIAAMSFFTSAAGADRASVAATEQTAAKKNSGAGVAAANAGEATRPASVWDRWQPSLERNWTAQHARMPSVSWDGDRVYVRDIRNFDFITERDFVARYYDRAFELTDLETVDFIVVPFRDAPALAHTMLSFGFRDGQQLIVSVEVRLEEGESYHPVLGAMRQFELIYVLADERDAIRLRTEVRQDDVYLYRARASAAQVQRLFVDVLRRVDELRGEPEFYDSLTNNCTTNIVAHINALAENRIPYQLDVLLPGYSANLAYNLGLLDRQLPFAELKQQSYITPLAHRYRDDPDFSRRIRAGKNGQPTDSTSLK